MIGDLIEHYRVLQRLGEGGMGTVYRALDTLLEREVALKILRADLSDQPDVTKRFRAEAVTLARLSHPHIATLFGLARHGAQLCMVMEYVQGDTLAQVLRAEPALSPERAVRVAAQVLSALDYAHLAGVVHRDIKPSNVVVSRGELAKVLDFGIARVLHTDRLTRQGFILGTPQYMAPEQIRGVTLDGRADVYSVGVLLYEMVAGCLPFRADNELALMYAHLEGHAIPLAQAVPGAPAWLCAVVARAMAKAPEDRFASAAEFRDALEQRLVTPLRVELPTMTASQLPPADREPEAARAATGRPWARVRSWLLPRFTWEYYAGPDGLLTLRRAMKAPATPQMLAPRMPPSTPSMPSASAAPVWPRPATRARSHLVTGAAALLAAAAVTAWFVNDTPVPAPRTETVAVRTAAGSAPSAPTGGGATVLPPLSAPPAAPDPGTHETPGRPPAPPPSVATPVERANPLPVSPGDAPASTPPSINAPSAAPAATMPAMPSATPAPTETPASPPAPVALRDEAFDDVVLLIPQGGGYDQVDVRVTFERDRLVVFDQDEERVVASIALAGGDGTRVSGTANLLVGSEHWFILPTSAGRIVLQVDEDVADRVVAAFEARSGGRVRKGRGELDGI